MTEVPIVTIRKATEHGWVRRPDLDRREDIAVWEKPDGTLYEVEKRYGEPDIATFSCAPGPWYGTRGL